MKKINDFWYPRIWNGFQDFKKIIKNENFDKDDRRDWKKAVQSDLRKWSNKKTGFVSQKAQEEGLKVGINLLKMPKISIPKIQVPFGKNTDGKKILVCEHAYTLKDLFNELLKCTTEIKFFILLNSYPGYCLILRDEDNKLNKNGFKSERDGEKWRTAYEKCNIKIINRNEKK